MQPSPSSPSLRVSSIISILGVVLITLGFFLPMIMQSNPQVPGSIHPLYEWQLVWSFGYSGSAWLISLTIAVLLPILCALIVLVASIVSRLRKRPSALLPLKRVAAICAFIIQLLLEFFMLILSSIGYARTDIGWGFVVLPVGFLAVLAGTLLE